MDALNNDAPRRYKWTIEIPDYPIREGDPHRNIRAINAHEARKDLTRILQEDDCPLNGEQVDDSPVGYQGFIASEAVARKVAEYLERHIPNVAKLEKAY